MADRDILSKQVKPSHYTIDLRNLDLEQWAYDGTVSISVGISEKLKKLTINSNQLKLVNAKIEIGSTIVAESDAFSYDETTQSVCITFNNEVVSTKEANIIITFQGAINDSLSGFYRSSYKPTVDPVTSVPRGADGSCFALSTHFQPSDARRAFPCFDAPNFKATFDLSLEVPIDQVALSNMPVKSTTPTKEGWQVVTFETSPRMSTYLLAWAIGDFGHVEGSTEREYNGKRIPVRIYAVRGIEHQGEFALTVAPKVVDLFSDLFHMPYPLPKMDLLAVPDLALGGMENWGLITVQLAALLFDGATASESFKENVASMVSHEISHQWFGNLVTMEWWDEIWLNEGFATWVGEYGVNHLFPQWNVWAQFITNRMASALQPDGLRSSHPVHVPVLSGMQSHQALDAISYGKGCAVIRMLASYLGIDTFMKGVSAYLEANAYGNAKAQSLWKHLGKASGRDVATMADSWINNPGYPVLTVEENLAKGEITLMQSRFLSSGDARQNDDTITWHIPLAIKGLDGGQNAILSTKQQTFSGVDNHFYIINAEGVGFYRVNYPPSRLAKLSTQLDKLSLADKISIIGSISALAMAGATPVTSLLAFIEGFRNETEPDAWVQLLDALSVVSGIFSDDSQIKDGLNQFKLRLIQDKAAGLSVDIAADDTYAIRRLRRLLRGNAVRSGHKEIIDSYLALFKKWEEDDKIDPAILPVVFSAAMQEDPSRTFKLLKEALAKSNSASERLYLLAGLSRTEDEESMRQAIKLNFATSPPKEVLQVMEMVEILQNLADHPVGRGIQWQYIKDNWDDVVAKIGHPIYMDHFVRISLSKFATEAGLADVEEFFNDKDTTSYAQALQNAKEEVRSRAIYRQRDSVLLKKWLIENKYVQ